MTENIVDKSIKVLQDAHGESVLFKLGDSTFNSNRPRMTTGSIKLDRILGGGWVRGSLNEIFGPESSGKTTVCIHSIAEAQKLGLVAFVDTEHSFDPIYAKNLGVDIDNLYVSQPDYAEQVFDIVETLASTGQFSLIIVDSIAGLVPRAEVEGDPGDSNMGLHARLNRQHLRKLLSIANRTKTTVIYTNQITYKIGVMFGNPETTSGGTGFKFFCSTRVDIRRISTLKQSESDQSIRCKVKVVKNKTAIPFQSAEIDIEFGKGIYKPNEIFDLGLECGVIEQSGAWFSMDGARLGQGRKNAIAGLIAIEGYENRIMGYGVGGQG